MSFPSCGSRTEKRFLEGRKEGKKEGRKEGTGQDTKGFDVNIYTCVCVEGM
jgi:hypothetical protein